MNFKDIISVILCYISLRVIDKFIEDNLPNLHYEKILAFFTPTILLAYIGWLSIVVKIIKNPEQKKALMALIILTSVSIFLSKAMEQQKKTVSQK